MDTQKLKRKKDNLYKKPSGQVLVEALVLLPLVCSCFVLCFLIFQVYAQHLWMKHQLYQSLICLTKGQEKSYCKNQMEKKIKAFLWNGKLKNIQFYGKEKEWKGAFIWKTRFWKIQFRQKLNLQDNTKPTSQVISTLWRNKGAGAF